MAERPILFSAPMVRAILDGKKTQTRRACKRQDIDPADAGSNSLGEVFLLDGTKLKCPYGQSANFGLTDEEQTGDRLHVRETFFAWGRWETRFSAKKGRDEWHFVDMTLESGRSYAYAADGLPAGFGKHHSGRGGVTPTWWKRPAIFMPRAACRITLEITGVRAERLQDISDQDARAEGIYPTATGLYQGAPRAAFQKLWVDINGPGSWNANPWVWVVTFERITP